MCVDGFNGHTHTSKYAEIDRNKSDHCQGPVSQF